MATTQNNGANGTIATALVEVEPGGLREPIVVR
jgi:hypothetical protein